MEEMDNLATSGDFEMGGPDTMDGREDDEKTSAPFNTNDYWADSIMHYYRHFNKDGMFVFRIGAMAVAPASILVFATLISSSASTLMAFIAMVIALFFVGLSMNMLGWILDKDIGPRSMQEVAEPIREGSEGFFMTQYGTIFKFAFVTAVGLFFLYSMRDPVPGSELNLYFSTLSMAFIMSAGFLVGACCSAISGYAGIWVSVRANLRVAAASRNDYNAALQICFRGGAFAAIINVALAIFGISFLYLCLTFHLYNTQKTTSQVPPIEEIPVLLVGFSFGASFVAMFAQLGGGIFTKAADVGADLVGKVELGIPEDDPRNPAVIADLVGDNVGDCAGQCADLFESISAEILSAMILGGAMAKHAGLDYETKAGFILFPLLVHSLDLTVSTIAVYFV